jgi:cytochrome oxidase Cu insertion factor (SCO1/SenC/PrrC family)
MVRPHTRIFLLALLSWLWSAASVLALGPTEGADLPPTDLERVAVGQPAPDFTLEDEKAAALTLSQVREKKNVVLVFYRGHW